MYRLIVLSLVAALCVSTAQAAKTFKWVDEKGVTHFSTRPPPGQHTDQSKLKGGTVMQPRSSTESRDLADIERVDLQNSGWRGCASSLCRLVQQLDPDCQTSYCSRAKSFSENCQSAACQTKMLVFERDVRERLATKDTLRRQQAINANAVPTPPATTE